MNVYQNNQIDEHQYEYVQILGNEKQSRVSFGDVLFTLSSETASEVGIGSVYLGNSEELYLNSFCFGVHIKQKNKVYPAYMSYLVSSQYFRKFIYPLAQGSTRFNLQKTDFMKKVFMLPTYKRQQQIANVLDALSRKLTTEIEQLSLLQIEKEFLFQQMFI